MIDINSLSESDKGRGVIYTSRLGDRVEVGRITSWNERYIFVRYHQQILPVRQPRFGDTSEATPAECLEFES